MIRIYLNEGDRSDGKPLYEAIVDLCRTLKIAGATVFRGDAGFGGTAELHRTHMLGHDAPVMVTIVDTEESIQNLVPKIEEMVESGLVVSSDVIMRRVSRNPSEEAFRPDAP